AENISGDELDDYLDGVSLDHNVNYTYAADAFSVSVSGRIGDAVVDSYAVGGRYNFGDAYVGLGYAKHSADDADIDAKVLTAVAGGTFGAFGVAAMYSDGEIEVGTESTDVDAWGVRASYNMDAWTFVAAYSESDTGAFGDFAGADAAGLSDQKGYGLAAAYDLGGGASLAGGVAKIDTGDGEKDTVGDFGITLSF
ncbi:MAG: porin, partial [Cereibacter changlensis]